MKLFFSLKKLQILGPIGEFESSFVFADVISSVNRVFCVLYMDPNGFLLFLNIEL